MKTAIALACTILGAAVLHAASPGQHLESFPPPREPLVKPMDANASWTITTQEIPSTEKKETAPPQPRSLVTSIESIRTGELKRDLITYASGQKEEVWYIQGQALSAASSRPEKVVIQSFAALEEGYDQKEIFRLVGNPVKSPGYPGFNWVDKRYYDAVTLFNKTIPAYHYVLRGKVDGQEIVAAEAWIDAQTGLPLGYTADGALYVYRFGEPPASPAILPPAFAASLQKVKQRQDLQRRLQADAAALR